MHLVGITTASRLLGSRTPLLRAAAAACGLHTVPSALAPSHSTRGLSQRMPAAVLPPDTSDDSRLAWISSFQHGYRLGMTTLDPYVFNADIRPDLMHRAVVWHLANRRQGTVKTKSRGEVRGGGKKPWQQKGTGRARASSIRSPLFKGGGVVHGPVPRDWSMKLPKKVRRFALRSALSTKYAQGDLEVVDNMRLETDQTAELVDIIGKHGWKNALFVPGTHESRSRIHLAASHLDHFDVRPEVGLTVHVLLKHEKVILTTAAVRDLETRLRADDEDLFVMPEAYLETF